ncbi:MAG: hypothetical protein J5606_03390 [Bacteroidales bacterium]|nr:hypothetical protein [Bacteroidales bacterium]
MSVKKLGIIITLVVYVIITISCQSGVKGYLRSFESFVDRIERHADSYTEKQWEKADNQFEIFTGEKYDKVEARLTSEQKKKVGELTARYYKVRLKSAGGDILDKIRGGLNYLEGFAGEIIDEVDKYQKNKK